MTRGASMSLRPGAIASLLGVLLAAQPVAAAEERFALVAGNAFSDAPYLGVRWNVASTSSLSLSYSSSKETSGPAGGPLFQVALKSFAFAYRYGFGGGGDGAASRLVPFAEARLSSGDIDINDPGFGGFLRADTEALRLAAGVEYRFEIPLSIEVSGGWQRATTRYDDGYEIEVETSPRAEVGLNFWF